MARYHFNLSGGLGTGFDDEGQEVATDALALDEAEAAARELSADGIRRGVNYMDCAFEVIADCGRIVGTVAFQDLFQPRPRVRPRQP